MTEHSLSLKQPACSIRSYSIESHSHNHDFSQWVFPLCGELEIEVENTLGRVDHTRAVHIAAGKQHCYAGSEKNMFLVLDHPLNYFLLDNSLAFCKIPNNIQHLLAFTKQSLKDSESSPLMLSFVSDLLFNTLLQNILQYADPKVIAAKNWIDAHVQEPINIKKLANQVFLSESQLQRQFSNFTGLTLAAYWRKLKMTKAFNWLQHSNYSIEQISEQLGYKDPSSFCRAFKDIYGISTKEARKKPVVEH